MFLVVEL